MLEDELVTYLKEPGFQRVIHLWIKQYERLSHLGGSIRIQHASEKEKESLGGFLGKDFRRKSTIAITWKEWEAALEKSRYEGVDFLRVLERLQGSRLLTNKERQEEADRIENQAFCLLREKYKDTKAEEWLNWMQSSKDNSWNMVRQLLRTHEEKLIQQVFSAINHLPVWEQMRKQIAVFAAEITQDPHFFDKGSAATLLYQGICYCLHIEDEDYDLAQRNKVFYDAGLLRDDLSNNCMIAHINALSLQKKPHQGWQGFYVEYEPWNVNLYNLQQIDSIADGLEKVFILENPAVFKAKLMHGKQTERKEIGFVCSNGQLNLCSYVLLDLLRDKGVTLYYAGDFDPEGLLIADKLKIRYKDQLQLMYYHKDTYQKCKSQKVISDKRMQMLEKCQSEELQEVIEELKKTHLSGYQEMLIQDYLRYMEG